MPDRPARPPEPPRAESDWQRKQRLAEVFGDLLPATTSDERGDDDGGAAERSSEEWLKSQVPPHHG